jgi:hypothetical protein
VTSVANVVLSPSFAVVAVGETVLFGVVIIPGESTLRDRLNVDDMIRYQTLTNTASVLHDNC